MKNPENIQTFIRRNGFRSDADEWIQDEAAIWNYSLLDEKQRRIQAGGEEKFLISELSPVITLGKRTSPSDIIITPADFKQMGVEVLNVDRGGMATYHGPGQWVFFPVARLESLVGDRKGVRKVVEALLETAALVAREYLDHVEIKVSPVAGVWSKKGKVASVGIRILDGYVLHGLSINGFQTETSFFGFRPCGMEASVDYLLGDSPSPEAEFEKMAKKIDSTARSVFGI